MEKQYVAKFEKVSVDQYMKDISNKGYIRKSLGLTEEWLRTINPESKLEAIISFSKNILRTFACSSINNLKLPTRATKASAGYDFFAPFDFTIKCGESIVIPTGVRCKFENENFALKIYPKSGLGFKYGVGLANTVGIVDADYYNSDNEGHIMIKLTNYDNHKEVSITKGKSFAQGIFEMYGLVVNDDEVEKTDRNGGFGSTSK